MGADDTLSFALDYRYLIMGGLVVFVLSNLGTSILRSEGDVNRTMYAMAIISILNIVIDSIFIYTFNMGITGAAWATLLSAFISCVVITHWLFVKRDTHLSFRRKDFKHSKKIVQDLLNIRLPTSTEIAYSIYTFHYYEPYISNGIWKFSCSYIYCRMENS